MRTWRAPRDTAAGAGQRGMIAAVALVILVIVGTLGLALLTASQGDTSGAARTRNRAEAFYVADGGMQGVLAVLKVNASNVVAATYPVVPGLLLNASDWGFTAENYPGGLAFSNMPGGQFTANDATSNVVVTMPVGRGAARTTVWLKSAGATLADPVVFGVISSGTLPVSGVSRTVTADITLVARGGRPANPLQTGGLGGPVLGFLRDGGTAIPGSVQRAGARVAILKASVTRLARGVPAVMSVIGAPTLTGGRPGPSPVMLIRPLMPCAIRSKPPRCAYGPVRPKPEMVQ